MKDLAKIRSVEIALDGAFRTETTRHHLGCQHRGRRPRYGAQGNVLGGDRSGAARCHNILILSDRGARPRSQSRFRPCSQPRPCTTTWFARACACRPGWSLRRAKPAKCTITACLRDMARKRSIPYVAFETLEELRARQTAPISIRPRSRGRTTSGRSARAYSRSCPKWASRPTSPIAAHRSSMRSASILRRLSTTYFKGTATTIEGIGLAGSGRRGCAAGTPSRLWR